MEGFTVAGGALVSAAQAGSALALDLQGVGVGAPVTRLATGLPGSATAGAVDDLARRWDAAVRALGGAMDRHAGHLADAAGHYEGIDAVVAGRLGAAG